MATIRTKMMIVSMAMFVLAGGATGAGLWSAKTLTKNVEGVAKVAAILRNHMQADMMHDALRADVLSAMLAQDPGADIDIKDVNIDLTEHISSFRSSLAANKELAADPSIDAVLSALDLPLEAYIDGAASIVGEASTEPANALAALPAFKAQFTTLETAMEKAGDSIQALSEQVSRDSEAVSFFIDKMLICIFGATVVAALALLYVSGKTIIKPIKTLSNDMQQLADGRTDIVLQGTGRHDEIGDMAAAVEVFRLAAISNKKLEADAVVQRERADADRGRLTEEAEAAARLKLQQATSSLATGLRRLASGDLSF